MPLRAYVIIIGLLITTGCGSTDNNPPANAGNAPASIPATMVSPATTSPAAPATSTVKAKVDACALLTSDDLKSVQGETLKEAQRSDRRDGAFIVAQCYYALPTTSNSVVLNVTTAAEGQGANNPRKFWEDTFGSEDAKGGDREKERERERAKKEKPAAGEEEEEGARPERVNGLGEEAFWLASRVGGALYVLKKDVFFRLSVGGAGDEKAKLKKSKTLAQQVLKRI
ncbi:MAG TPA: hypothetical protein VK475_02960 [Pyrinomonadaceae bacterium]|nr:hypothetical protein [Pyrinomonadaceae bacterium]